MMLLTVVYLQDPTTPHPLREVINAPISSSYTSSRSSVDASSTGSGSPFPPTTQSAVVNTPSPNPITAALTSTPYSRQSRSRSRSTLTGMNETQTTLKRHDRTRSGTGELGSSTDTRRERWQTPGEMSLSFSGDEIPVGDPEPLADDLEQLGAENSVPLNDASLVRLLGYGWAETDDPCDAGRRGDWISCDHCDSPYTAPILESCPSGPTQKTISIELLPAITRPRRE